MARPTAYKKEYAEQARKLCLLGATDVDLAEFFDVAKSTINLWKKKHPEFSDSIKKGKTVADAEVAESLYKRAIGIEYTETKVSNDGSKKKQEVTKKFIPPDAVSAIFWLKNRQPSKWRDKPFVEDEGEIATPVSININVVDARVSDDITDT
ncbi:terminase [Providencia rettgeri]|uniref:terminase n=1 Tax=Providencia rettgeri TaxID=587 RepID=UPI003D2B0876